MWDARAGREDYAGDDPGAAQVEEGAAALQRASLPCNRIFSPNVWSWLVNPASKIPKGVSHIYSQNKAHFFSFQAPTFSRSSDILLSLSAGVEKCRWECGCATPTSGPGVHPITAFFVPEAPPKAEPPPDVLLTWSLSQISFLRRTCSRETEGTRGSGQCHLERGITDDVPALESLWAQSGPLVWEQLGI